MKAKGIPHSSDEPFDEEVVVEQQETPTPEQMEEAHYWMTIHDFVMLLSEHGNQKVLSDMKDVAGRLQREFNKDKRIITL